MRSQAGSQSFTQMAWFRFLGRHVLMVVYLLLALTGMTAVYWLFSPSDSDAAAFTLTNQPDLSAPLTKPVPDRPVLQRLAQSPGPLRIGIIVGHRNNDSGAVCDDGLTELQINTSVAEAVHAQMQAAGVQVELLDEFDPRLRGYYATALISIHADSCVYYNELATGFKVAGSSFTDSTQLSICLEDSYRNATQMFYHENTITPHMTDYHAFREISPGVPAVIIEVGFMNLDREMLTTKVDLPTRGVVDGINCFLNSHP